MDRNAYDIYGICLGLGAVITILLYLPPILNTGLDTMLGNRFISGDSPETGYLTFKDIPWMVKDIIFTGTPQLLLALFLHLIFLQVRLPAGCSVLG